VTNETALPTNVGSNDRLGRGAEARGFVHAGGPQAPLTEAEIDALILQANREWDADNRKAQTAFHPIPGAAVRLVRLVEARQRGLDADEWQELFRLRARVLEHEEARAILRELAEVCAEVCDLTQQAYRDKIQWLGARSRALEA
jgi:hypothetical protein